MEVVANGDRVALEDGSRLTDLLDALGLRTRWVVAEVNGRAVDRNVMGETVLADGDQVELVRAVAGG